MHVLDVNLLNICVCSRFLRTKIVRRNTQHDQSLILVGFLNFIEHRVLLMEDGLAGEIHDQQHFALVRGERDFFPLQADKRIVVDRLRRFVCRRTN